MEQTVITPDRIREFLSDAILDYTGCGEAVSQRRLLDSGVPDAAEAWIATASRVLRALEAGIPAPIYMDGCEGWVYSEGSTRDTHGLDEQWRSVLEAWFREQRRDPQIFQTCAEAILAAAVVAAVD